MYLYTSTISIKTLIHKVPMIKYSYLYFSTVHICILSLSVPVSYYSKKVCHRSISTPTTIMFICVPNYKE